MKEKKQTVAKRIAALFLAFALVIGVVPLTEQFSIHAGAEELPTVTDAAETPVTDADGAGSPSWVDAGSALSVYQALSGNSDAYIRLTADISEVHGSRDDPTGNVDYTPYWCVIGKGNKVLDLNGHTLRVTYALNYDPESTDERRSVYARRGSTLFKVGGGTTFTLCDKKGGGELNYAGVLSDTQSLWRDVRNVIEVSGETGSDAVFIMNGGSIVPGNTGRFKLNGSTDPLGEERIVSGNGVVVGSHSSVTINAGHIEALGEFARDHATGYSADFNGGWIRCACVQTLQYFSAVPEWDAKACIADDTTTLYINDCELEGSFGANALSSMFGESEYNPKVLIRSGTLSNSTGQFYYRNASGKIMVMSQRVQTSVKALDTAKYNVYSVDLKKSLDSEYCSDHNVVNGDLVIVPKDKYTPVMWSMKDGTNTSMRMPSYPSEWNSKEDITFCAAFGGTKMSAQNTSVWPYPVPDSSYPTGEGAPEHTITYSWRIYDCSGTSAQSAVYDKIGDSTFSPKNDLSAEDRKNLFTNTIYMMRCVITETYKGQHTYTVNVVCSGYFKVVPYKPPVDVQFRLHNTGDGAGLYLEDTCSPWYLENKKKNGYIGGYEYIVKNVADNYVYKNCSYTTNSSWIMLDETEMKAHTVGIFDISVEVKLYADEAKKNEITTYEEFKGTQTVGWLPNITCPQDNGADDKDNAEGSIRFVGEGKVANIQLNAPKITGDEWGVYGGGSYYQPPSETARYVAINSEKGGGRYRSYVKGKDSGGNDIYYYSPNSIMIQFDDPQYTWDTTGTNIPSKIITTTTTFDATYKLSATVSVEGKTVSQPNILWTVSDTPDNKDINKPIVNRFKAGTTTVLTEGKSFKNDVQLRDIINVSPQDFPEGNFTFRCELYDGSYKNKANLLSYSDVTVSFVLGNNEYHLWTTRDGEYQEVTDSWLYIDDENSFITIDVKGNPEFTNLGVLKSYTIGDGYEAKDFESSIGLKVTLEETDANGQQKFTFSRKGSGTKTLTLCHPAATEFKVDRVDAPKIGEPVSEAKAYVPEGANYTAKVIWYLNDGDAVTSGTFQPNNVYRAYISFIPNEGVVMPILPWESGTSVYDLDAGAVTCLGMFDGEYEVINTGDPDSWAGFDGNPYIVKGNMPVADGKEYFAYKTMYKTFDRLIDPDSDDEYISELRFTFDTPVDGDKREDFKISVEPKEAISQLTPGEPYISNTITRDRDGSTTFEKFEEYTKYTCVINNLTSDTFGTGKHYFFADDMVIYVNGSMLSGSSFTRTKYNAARIDSITFSFYAYPVPVVIDSFGFDDIPEVVVGETVDTVGQKWYDDNITYYYEWFEDNDNDGIFNFLLESISDSSFTFEEGKTYGVEIAMWIDTRCYRFADTVTISCNGVNKTALINSDKWCNADFIMDAKPCTHEHMTLVPAVDSTCSAAGHIAYCVCDKCGKWFKEDKVTEITDHESIELPLAPHTPGEPVKENIVEAKCGTDGGYDLTTYCTVCSSVISTEHRVIPALGHDWGEWHITVEPTEGTEGTEKRECSRCDEFETRSLEYLGFPVTIGSGKDYETIADAIKQINKDIKNKTAKPNGYNFIISDTHTETKAIALPKTDIKFAITGGELILSNPTITANANLVVYGKIDSAKDNKPITIKAAAGKTVNILKLTTVSTLSLSGNKTSNFLLNTGTALNIVNLKAANVEIGKGTTVKLAAKGKFTPAALTGEGTLELYETSSATLTDVKNTNIILNEYTAKDKAAMPKLIIGASEAVTITVKNPAGELTDISGKQLFTTVKPAAGKYLNSITVINKSGDNTLNAVPYKKNVRAEWLGALTLTTAKGSENYPSFDKAFDVMTDSSEKYVIVMNDDIFADKLTIPAKAGEVTIDGCGRTLTVKSAVKFGVKEKLTIKDVELRAVSAADKLMNVTFDAPKGLTLTDVIFTAGSVSIKGKGDLNISGVTGDIAGITGFATASVNGSLRLTKAFAVPTITLGSTAAVTLAKTATITAKTALSGAEGSVIIFEEGAKTVTASGDISGKIKLTGVMPAKVILSVSKTLTDDALNAVFTLDGKTLKNDKGKVIAV